MKPGTSDGSASPRKYNVLNSYSFRPSHQQKWGKINQDYQLNLLKDGPNRSALEQKSKDMYQNNSEKGPLASSRS